MAASLQGLRRHTAAPLAAATLLVGGVAVTSLPGTAYAGPGESGFVASINAARSAHGLRPYSVAGDLLAMARAQAARMAARGTIYHNPALATEVTGWLSIGENVGSGPSVGSIAAAFLASPEHRANILSAHFTQVAVGTATGADGTLYVDEVFRQPDSATAAPAPTTAPAPATTAPATRAPKPAATTTAPAAAPTSTASPSRTAAPTASATSVPPRAARTRQRADRSMVRAPLPAAAQRVVAAAGRHGAAAGTDPLARSVSWWRAMRGLGG